MQKHTHTQVELAALANVVGGIKAATIDAFQTVILYHAPLNYVNIFFNFISFKGNEVSECEREKQKHNKNIGL